MEYRYLIALVVILIGNVMKVQGQGGPPPGGQLSRGGLPGGGGPPAGGGLSGGGGPPAGGGLPPGDPPPGGGPPSGGGPQGPGAGDNTKGKRPPEPNQSTTKKVKKRTTPRRVSLEENCDYLAYYCMKAYKTGRLCARTIYFKYHNFTNYCLMDYVNCMERYEVWQVAHMGDCFELTPLKDYQHYEYHDDLFLDQLYVVQE